MPHVLATSLPDSVSAPASNRTPVFYRKIASAFKRGSIRASGGINYRLLTPARAPPIARALLIIDEARILVCRQLTLRKPSGGDIVAGAHQRIKRRDGKLDIICPCAGIRTAR